MIMFMIHLIGYISMFILAMQVISFMMQGGIVGGFMTAVMAWKTYTMTVYNGIASFVTSFFNKNQ